MADHPFFDASKYPWHRQEAKVFYKILCDLIQNPNEIELIYEQCGEDLPPLALGQAPNLIWRDALDNLAAAGLLKELIKQIQERYPKNEHVQRVLNDVLNAKPTPPPPPPSTRWRVPKVALVILTAAVISILAAITYKACGDGGNDNGPDSKIVSGRVYYQTAGNSALIPVKDVVVYLSYQPDLMSEPTDNEGRFSLQIPASSQIDLTARYGERHFKMGYQETGEYPVIPPEEHSDLIVIETPWNKVNERCLANDGKPRPLIFQVYSQVVEIPAEKGKSEATLTVELVESPNIAIRSAYVRGTPKKLYSKVTTDKDRSMVRTWLFTLPTNGLKTRLDVCLGSDNRDTKVSEGKLSTYYQLN